MRNESAAKTARAWTSLVLLCAESTSESRADMLSLIEEIMDHEQKAQDALAIDLMKAGEELKARRAHADRLLAFLTAVLKTCKEYGVPAARPHAESLREYLEAWNRRSSPSDEELCQRFAELVRQCRQDETP